MARRYMTAMAPLLMAAATAGSAIAARPSTDPGKAAFQRFNGGPSLSPFPASESAERPKPKAEDEKPRKATETDAAIKAQEESNLLRRLSVCDRIKQIALETSDAKLEAHAMRLEERATEVYKQRVANLGGRRIDGGAK